MREIIFRGKRIDNGEWIYGSFTPHALDGSNSDLVSWGFIKRYNRGIRKMETTEVDPETVGQYTGLKDKNGQKIFEGDIIHWDWEKIPYLVYWSDKTCQFTTDMRWLWSSIENVEILSNIHDNPELMED